MSDYDRNKGTKEPKLVYSEITGHVYIAYKKELIDVTAQVVELAEKVVFHSE